VKIGDEVTQASGERTDEAESTTPAGKHAGSSRTYISTYC